MIGVLTFVILTALGGFVRIPLPFTPVPITLQTFFVLLSAALLGRRLGVTSQAIYALLGVFAAPLFLGPTAGYMLGFIVAAFLTGNLIKHAKDSFLLTFGIFCLADLALLLCGTLWLKLIFGYSFGKLLLIGVVPFIPGDILKAMAATAIYLKLHSRVREVF